MSLVRVLRTAAATLTKKVYSDDTLTDASTIVTVAATRLDGTAVVSGTAGDAPGLGVYTYTLPGGPTGPGSATWQLDHLNVSWTGVLAGATTTLPPDRVEVVGGFLFGLAEARASDPSLADPVRYLTEDLAAKRTEVEVECERICGQAFVPRFARTSLVGDGSDVLLLPHHHIRAIRSVKYWNGTTWATLAAASSFSFDSAGILYHDAGVFPTAVGGSNIIVEYEHGWDYPPPDLVDKAMVRLKDLLNQSRSGVSDRWQSYTTPETGTVVRQVMPQRDGTGIPSVDAVYESYASPIPGFA